MRKRKVTPKTRGRQREILRLNVATWWERSLVNGPGARFVVWLQGCRRRCPGCLNPEMHALAWRQRMKPDELAARILGQPGVEGVTFSGGEPLGQVAGLVALSRRLREAGLSIVCYTGYTLEELRQSTDDRVREFLGMVDILIDGPFQREQAGFFLWRGSANQRIHYLSPRYADLETTASSRLARMEMNLQGDRLFTTGIWPEGLMEEIQRALPGTRTSLTPLRAFSAT